MHRVQPVVKQQALSGSEADLCGGDCHRQEPMLTTEWPCTERPCWGDRGCGAWGTTVPPGQASPLSSLAAGSPHDLLKLFNVSASGSRLAVVKCLPCVQPGSNPGDGKPPRQEGASGATIPETTPNVPLRGLQVPGFCL